MSTIVFFIVISFCVFYGTGKLVTYLLKFEDEQDCQKENKVTL